MLAAIDPKDPRKLAYKKALENPEEFLGDYREIECADLVSLKFKIQLKLGIGIKELDFRMWVDGQEVLAVSKGVARRTLEI